jgi:tyrosyl-tRNA synthetase
MTISSSDNPFAPQSEFLRVLAGRGFIHQCTDLAALDARLCAGPMVAYNGLDLTADSLHVGHLVPIMMLRWLQKTGHKPIVLMGGGTSRIGDPSFRDTSRPLLSDEGIEANLRGVRQTFERFLVFGDGPTDAVMVNNADWLDGLGYIDFLRDFGRHFSINRMLTFDSVRQRLEREQSLSLLEFNYMVIQAYDFLELARTRQCALQLGGSDQWGNIVNGVELARRADGVELFGLTAPLLATSSGAKMGKSAAVRSGSIPTGWRPTTSGSSGGIRRMLMSAASCACSPNCRSTRSSGLRHCAARRSTRPRSCWPMR